MIKSGNLYLKCCFYYQNVHNDGGVTNNDVRAYVFKSLYAHCLSDKLSVTVFVLYFCAISFVQYSNEYNAKSFIVVWKCKGMQVHSERQECSWNKDI